MKNYRHHKACLLGWIFSSSTLLLAHHPTGQEMPQTGLDGLLSGLAHPVIGLDHLAYLLIFGLLLAQLKRPQLVWSFILASLGGCALAVLGLSLPAIDQIVAMSVMFLAVAVILLHSMTKKQSSWLALVGISLGVLHGFALAESVVGAETTPLISYLLGFSVIQLVLMLGAYGIGLWSRQPSTGWRHRLVWQTVPVMALIVGTVFLF